MLTQTTTRRQWLEHLAVAYAKSAPFGGNGATLNHMVKVHNLTDAEWLNHRAKLLESSAEFKASGMAAVLTSELMQKNGRRTCPQ
jgi:hypothetical protein